MQFSYRSYDPKLLKNVVQRQNIKTDKKIDLHNFNKKQPNTPIKQPETPKKQPETPIKQPNTPEKQTNTHKKQPNTNKKQHESR